MSDPWPVLTSASMAIHPGHRRFLDRIVRVVVLPYTPPVSDRHPCDLFAPTAPVAGGQGQAIASGKADYRK